MKKNVAIIVFYAILLIGSAIFPVVASFSNSVQKSVETTLDGKILDLEPLENLPDAFSWRNVDGVDFSTAVKNQRGIPSCESFAMLSALEALVQIKVGFPFECDLSEAHLFFWSGGVIDWGSYPENNTKFLKEHGVPDEACWPYPKGRYQYPKNTTSPDWRNRTVKIRDWYYLPEDIEVIKTALYENGPIPTYFLVYKDFLYYKRGIYRHRWGGIYGPHYVCIMGYNDNPGYWIVKGSWGPNQHDNGWFKIAYGECAIEKKSFYLEDPYGKFPIVYVDDDNTGGPWNGSKNSPYQTIQDAVDNVFPLFTIYVKNGTYNENVFVNKSVRIVGEHNENVIVDGGGVGDVITIASPGVTIADMTVRNSGKHIFESGIKTLTLSATATIKNNIIYDCDIGLFLNYAYNDTWNIIEGNTIYGNREGMYTHWAFSTEISNNIIKENAEVGLEMHCSHQCTIKENVIRDNGNFGINIRGSSYENKINSHNKICNNSIGIQIEESHINEISENDFINNSVHAYIYKSFLNKWKKNYWDDHPRILPKFIKGKFGGREFPYFNVDWRPSRNPYNSKTFENVNI
jgi:parallel beta-helix repeat protein